MCNKSLTVSSMLLATVFSFNAFAATEQQLPGVIDRTLPSFQIPKSHSIDSDRRSPLQPMLEKERVADGDKAIAFIKAITFTGSTSIPEESLQRVAKSFTNRQLNKNDFAQLKHDITKLFYSQGYILVKAITPPQDLSDGILEVKIFEANIGNIRIKNNNVIYDGIPQGISKRVKSTDIFNETDVESMVADIDELSDVRASVVLLPGKEFGTTDLNVVLEKANEESHYVRVDNYGHEQTGSTVATIHVEQNNLFHLGGKYHATGRISEDSLRSYAFGSVIPTSFRNVTLDSSYLYSQNDIQGTLQSGETHIFNAALSSAIINTRNKKAKVSAGLEVRSHESKVGGLGIISDDDIRQVYISASYLHRGARSVWYSSAKISKGLGIFGASNKGDANASRTANGGGDPDALKFEPVLVANFQPNDNGILKLIASGQIASDVLLASDLFVIGGYGSVRGFQPAHESGESGYQFSAEYAHSFDISPDWDFSAGPFIDGGSVYNRVDGATVDNNLYSAGIGVEAVTELIAAGDTRLRLDWAHPLGNYKNDYDSNTFYVRLNQDF